MLRGMEVLSGDRDTASLSGTDPHRALQAGERRLHLELVWSRDESARIGECSPVLRAALLGRGPHSEAGDPPKAEFFRSRPGSSVPTGALQAPTVSRRQWLVTPRGQVLHVSNVGKQELLHNGWATSSCQARSGDTLAVSGTALFLVTERTTVLPGCSVAPFTFGQPDGIGWVGESDSAWALRKALSDVAAGNAHVLLLGSSGAGKELCAKAVHLWSRRNEKTFVSRSAATLPSGILEAELFGNAANYPHSGMPARAGLIGAADGGTLFLDEVGELSERDQATFLRVLDAGEYQRLGEERIRKSNLRVVAATNRAPESLKFDLLARFPERVSVPDLNQRRGDIPLITRHLISRLTAEFCEPSERKVSLRLMDALIRHRYTTNMRELEKLLRLSWRQSPDHELELTPTVERELDLPGPETEISADAIRRALDESRSTSEAARRLGLPSRYALHRLSKKFGVVAE